MRFAARARTKSVRQPTTIASRTISARVTDCDPRQRPTRPPARVATTRGAAGSELFDIVRRLDAGRSIGGWAIIRWQCARRFDRHRDRPVRSVVNSTSGASNAASSAASTAAVSSSASAGAGSADTGIIGAGSCTGRLSRLRSRALGGHFGDRFDGAADRRQRLGGRHQLVGMGQFRLPDRAAAHAAHPTAVRLQTGHLDIVRCSAVRANDQHRRIRAAAPFRQT